MTSLSRFSLCLLSLVILLTGINSPALADWFEGDGHKMHHPQLPDPDGWDIRVSNGVDPNGTKLPWIVADDWRCSESGAVSDVHFWVSWLGDDIIGIENVHLSVHSDVPQGPDGWSIPGQELWARDFSPNEFNTIFYGAGAQGWIDPQAGTWNRPDHQAYYQINVTDIVDPFIQVEDTIYWLDVSVDLSDPSGNNQLGWKTSLDHWNDDAVYWEPDAAGGSGGRWVELLDPITGQSLDMAFVIVPEPSSCIILGIGIFGLFVTLRRTRKSA